MKANSFDTDLQKLHVQYLLYDIYLKATLLLEAQAVYSLIDRSEVSNERRGWEPPKLKQKTKIKEQKKETKIAELK